MDSRSPSREGRPARSPTPRSRYSRSPSPAPRRNGRYRSESRSRSRSRSRSYSRSRSRSFSRDRESRGRSQSPLRGSTKIVVEKLTKNVNEDHLREIFGTYGPIRDLDLPMNRQFNTNRGTAYILYVHEADAEAAIAHMHEALIDGAVINVSIVLPRRKFSPSPPVATRGANIDPRIPAPGRGGHRGPGGRNGRGPGLGGGPMGGPPGGGRARFGGGHQRRDQDYNTYRPRTRSRSYSRSPPRRGRSPSYDSRSRSPQRRRGGGRRDSFDDYDRGDRRRSPSYDSYRSRSRGRGYR